MKFAEILVQHPYSRKQGRFTYELAPELDLKPGDGVFVPFQKGEKLGLILKVHSTPPSFPTKRVEKCVEEQPLLFEWQVKLAEWMSEYYFCSLWDCIRLLLPKNIHKKKRKKAGLNKKIEHNTAKQLTPEQARVYNFILDQKPSFTLIEGVTGSGKTELYKRLIQEKVAKGGQCLLLVPEISLTPQFIAYFKEEFPTMAVVHSKISEGERTEQWHKIKRGEVPLVLGSRSALFSPFKNLALIVMDEEHEWSYKQDQSPRYHARSVVEKIQEHTGTQVVYGSATPSIETRYRAEKGEIAHQILTQRALGTPLPTVEIVDMRDELKKKNFSMFSDRLEQEIKKTLDEGQQVLLFLNRRGSGSSTVCRDCGKTAECPECALPFTYHARNFSRPSLVCHHCGRFAPVPEVCKRCGSVRIRQLGTGTEKIETELEKLFPRARLARADKDTMNLKDSFTQLREKMQAGEIDILIGTQMIGKGWDLPRIGLVGVVLADMGLNLPDFRASERGFQLLTQVAGRAGRAKTQGKVLIQSYNPENPVIQHVKTHDYQSFYLEEHLSRELDQLPPYGKIVKVMFVEESAKKAEQRAKQLMEALPKDNHKVYAAPAFLTKVKGKHQWNVLIQGSDPRALLKKTEATLLKGARIDVDPLVCL